MSIKLTELNVLVHAKAWKRMNYDKMDSKALYKS